MNNTHHDEELYMVYESLGYIGGGLVCVTYFPQVLRVYQTKSTKDISLIFLILGLTASIFMTIYGFFINELPLMITNPIIGSEIILLLIAKIIYDKDNICKKKLIEQEQKN